MMKVMYNGFFDDKRIVAERSPLASRWNAGSQSSMVATPLDGPVFILFAVLCYSRIIRTTDDGILSE